MAVPVVISAYSTLLILLGHCIFVGTIRSTNNSSNGNGTTTLPSKYSSSISEPGFMIVAGIPIIIGIVMAGGAVIVAEAMYNRSADESTKRLEEGLVQRSR
ncbi:hypothetical protein JAAARDRAFT_37410 [Jaapia argillacea MUCL 33604]|uniref:Uncharacterized protein n=1 Tax=Jaapia argillacea MUCL 33604 TaxID=933084 RepID=A0A067PKM7_9AGAM|nr:hypothetical protein JAAARDRAFT_37410 [Jaapia argillacea MUCL 33604]